MPVNLENVPMTKKIVSSQGLRLQELCLEEILPWESFLGSTKFTSKPKGIHFRIPIPSYNKFLDIYNEVTRFNQK